MNSTHLAAACQQSPLCGVYVEPPHVSVHLTGPDAGDAAEHEEKARAHCRGRVVGASLRHGPRTRLVAAAVQAVPRWGSASGQQPHVAVRAAAAGTACTIIYAAAGAGGAAIQQGAVGSGRQCVAVTRAGPGRRGVHQVPRHRR